MDTNDLRRLIGKDCLVIDPRSKKKEYEPATIVSVLVQIETICNNETVERVSYYVSLHKLTVTKKNRYGEVYEYHRSFMVGGSRIKI